MGLEAKAKAKAQTLDIGGVDGSWIREHGRQPIGSISDGVLRWNKGYSLETTDLKMTGDGNLEMDLSDAPVDSTARGVYTGVFKPEASPASITWSDGEVWVKEPPSADDWTRLGFPGGSN